jgi:hypothetical protein
MAAVPFTETLILKGNSNGRVMHIPLTVSDVADAFAIAPDGNGFLQLPSDQDYSIIDLIVVTGGTDTNFQKVFVNGLDTGLQISNKSNLNTSNFRQFATAPVAFKAGSLIRFKQAA